MDKQLNHFLTICIEGTVDEIKNVINNSDIDAIHSYVDEKGNTGLHLACLNKNSNIVQYLIADLKMDILAKNNYNETVFLYACKYNNFDVIKYIASKILQTNDDINTCIASLHDVDVFGYDPSIIACMFNNINVVRYLVEELYFTCNTLKRYGFLEACSYTQYPEIIRYLANELKVNIEVEGCSGNKLIDRGYFGHNGFLRACINNPNITIIKCLIQEFKFDTKHTSLGYGKLDALALVCMYNSNHDIFTYLINETNCITGIFSLNSIVSSANYIVRLKEIDHPVLNILYSDIQNNKLKLNMQKTYEYIISSERYELFLFEPFLDISKYFNEVDYHAIKFICTYIYNNIQKIPLKEYSLEHLVRLNTNLKTIQKTEFNVFDFFQIPFRENISFDMFSKNQFNELIFSCEFINDNDTNSQSVKYYGSKWWIYHIIPTLKNMVCFGGVETIKGVVLKIEQNKNIFDAYIIACHTGKLNINKFDINDMLHLVILVDMYPNIIFSIHDIEHIIIERLNDVENATMIFAICDQYAFKKLLIAQYELLNNMRRNIM